MTGAMGAAVMTDAPIRRNKRQVWSRQVDVGDGVVPIHMAGDGPPLIMLHGWTLDWRMWLPQIDHLAKKFLLVIPDRRGFGRSTAPPDLAREAEDVNRIADLLGFDRYALLGLSQGGAVALDCAQRRGFRINALVISGAPLPALVERDEHIDLDRYETLAQEGQMDVMRADWSQHALMAHENPETSMLVDVIVAEYEGRDLLAPSSLPGVPSNVLCRLPMPVLAMTGNGDSPWRRECAKALADVVPRGSHNLVERAGHLANLDNPAQFNRIVDRFLSRCGISCN